VTSDGRVPDGLRQDGAATPLPAFAPSPTPLRRHALFVVLVGIVLIVALVRLVVRAPEPSPLGIEIQNPTTLVLVTRCAEGVSARLAESADSVRIDQITGHVMDGDCTGGVEIELSAPLRDRLIFVAGEQWTETDASCAYGEFGPGGTDVPPDCR